MAHVGADDGEPEVDEDVLEQPGMLAGGAHPRPGYPDVYRDGQTELGAGGVEGQ